MFIKREDTPVYVMVFLIFFGFCNFVKLPFDKDILIVILNGLFILIAAIYGTNTLARRNQMRRYSEDLIKMEESILDEFATIKATLSTWATYPKKLKSGDIDEDGMDDFLIEHQSKYNDLVLDYKILLTEIRLYCGEDIENTFKLINYTSWQDGTIHYLEGMLNKEQI